MPTFYKIAVVGARRRRQGTGAFIAACFAQLGHEVCAIVGTGDDSIAAAQADLQSKHGIQAKGYTDIATLFNEQDIDVLVIASPDTTHLEYLHAALRAGCHVFCEKPLWWPDDDRCPAPEDAERTATDLVKRFNEKKRVLFVNLQWPHTLSSFQALYPDLSLAAGDIARFAMHLSPESTGTRMVIDAAPHPLSMLHQLVGDGDILNATARYDGATRDALTLSFDYHHPQGGTAVTLTFKRDLQQPKPAGYAINGKSVERRVRMPDYLLSLASSDQNIPIKDPLMQSIEAFMDVVQSKGQSKAPNRAYTIVAGMKQLCQLVKACGQTDDK